MPATAIPSWTTVAASLGNWGWWLSLQVVLTPSDRKTAWHPWASVVVCSTLSEPLTGLRPGYCELGSATNAHRNQTARFFTIHQQARNAELPGCLQLCMALYQSQNFLASHERLRYHVAVLSVPEHSIASWDRINFSLWPILEPPSSGSDSQLGKTMYSR